jgi:hypothetical protein
MDVILLMEAASTDVNTPFGEIDAKMFAQVDAIWFKDYVIKKLEIAQNVNKTSMEPIVISVKMECGDLPVISLAVINAMESAQKEMESVLNA